MHLNLDRSCTVSVLCSDVPELTALVGQEKVTAFLASEDSNQELNLEKCFRTLMTASENEVKVQLASLLKRAADTSL